MEKLIHSGKIDTVHLEELAKIFPLINTKIKKHLLAIRALTSCIPVQAFKECTSDGSTTSISKCRTDEYSISIFSVEYANLFIAFFWILLLLNWINYMEIVMVGEFPKLGQRHSNEGRLAAPPVFPLFSLAPRRNF